MNPLATAMYDHDEEQGQLQSRQEQDEVNQKQHKAVRVGRNPAAERTDSLAGANSSISKILERTHDNDHYHSFKLCDCISSAQQEIEAYILDIIGEDAPEEAMEQSGWNKMMRMQGRNELRAEQRDRLKGKK